jgi:hypothetical protein
MAQPKPALRAPEGKWLSKLERTCATSFSPDLAPVLSAAELSDPESGSTVQLLLLSTQQLLCIYNPQSPDRVRRGPPDCRRQSCRLACRRRCAATAAALLPPVCLLASPPAHPAWLALPLLPACRSTCA